MIQIICLDLGLKMNHMLLYWLQLIRKSCVQTKGEAALHWISVCVCVGIA